MTVKEESPDSASGSTGAGAGVPTTSIAPVYLEILSAILANGLACHNWLSLEVPNFDRAYLSVGLIVRDAAALSKILSQMRLESPARP